MKPRTLSRKSTMPKKLPNKITLSKRKPKQERGIIYIGHLPHGFYETQLEDYFTQFGKVSNVRVSRNIDTRNSRGYAFVEFTNKDVAQVAAETMNGYLMFERLLKCHVVENPHKTIFREANFEARLNKKMRLHKRFNSARDKPGAFCKVSKSISSQMNKINKKLRKNKVDVKYTFHDDEGVKQVAVQREEKNNASILEQSPYVMEIDSSDTDISFRTPPHCIKVMKKKNTKKVSKNAKRK